MKRILIIIVVLIVGAGILLVSMSRATLEIMSKDEKEGRLRIEPVEISGNVIYKLPQTNMLPDNIFYGFKEMRDWFWQKFSFGDEKEAKTVLILADKRIAEARALANRGKIEKSLEAGIRAVDKLKYANGLVMEMRNQDTVQKQLTIQIRESSFAYSEIIREIGQKDNTNKKYLLLQKNINDFKEEQIQKEANTKN